jgi:hypothetical protein
MRVLLSALLAAGAVAGPVIRHTSADTRIAQASLLKSSDFTKGWSGTATPQTGAQLSCSGHAVNGAGVVETGAATSPNFSYGTTGPFVSQNTSVYATSAQANTYWRRAVTPQLATCVSGVLRALAARGIKVTITSQGKLPLTTSLSHTAAYRAVGTVGKNKLTYYVDVVVLGEGKAITSLAIISIQNPTSAKVEKALATLVATRLSGGAGAA